MKIKVIAIDSCTACITFCTEKPSTIFFFFFLLININSEWFEFTASTITVHVEWLRQRQERQERTILLWLQLKARRCPTRSNHSSHFKGLRAATVTSTGDRFVNQRVHKNRSRLSANRFSHCHLSSCAIKETSIFIPAASPCFFFFSLWLHCRNSSIISSVLQNHNGATFQSREETISSPPPLPRVDVFTLESKKSCPYFIILFHSACDSFSDAVVNTARKLASKVIYTSEHSQLCQHQLQVRSGSEWIHFARGGTAPRLAVLSGILEVIHHARAKKKKTERWTHYSENIAFDNAHLFW